jgi:lysozyme
MSTQHCNEAGKDIIRSRETLRLKAYRCPAGVPTIGWGHTRGVKMGDTCTREQADAWLAEDLAEAERAICRYITQPLTSNQFSSLVSWTYNLGAGTLQRSDIRKMINVGNCAGVPDEMRLYVYAKNRETGKRVKLNGLVTRRKEEAALWSTPDGPV